MSTKKTSTPQTALSPAATRALVHNLQVHQTELEAQNEELHRVRSELEAARARYFDLYDVAPVGYCTLGSSGLIIEANLTLSTLLGVARGALTRQPFSRFVSSEDRNLFCRLQKRLLASPPAVVAGAPVRPTPGGPIGQAIDSSPCELRLVRSDGSPFWAELIATSVPGENGEAELRMVLAGINERKRVEAALVASEENYRLLFAGMLDGFALHEIICDAAGRPIDYRFLSVNPAFERLTGLRAADAIGRTVLEILPGTESKWIERYGRVALTGEGVEFEEYSAALDRYFEVAAFRPRPGQFATVFIDITASKRAEQGLQLSLREKEALLKEVHHRVKNNLQVILSLLRMEGRRSAQPDTRSALGEMQGRIRSMALLHEALFRSGTFASVDLGGYLRELAKHSFRALGTTEGLIRLQLELSSVEVEMDQALPCGLLVNELVTNALKHGFPDGRTGEVRLELQPGSDSRQWRLRVSDNGVGLPDDFEIRRSQRLGLQLVSDLAKQLGGTLEIGPAPAAAFTITFSPVASTEAVPAQDATGR
jgi:PAS domain S-box-containing protein